MATSVSENGGDCSAAAAAGAPNASSIGGNNNNNNSSSSSSSSSNRFHLADAVAEWRSREQLEPSVPSTSPGYFDSDEDDTSALASLPGPKPADLYGKFTWKIENFSEISKRELRSNVFEVGGYKWYILVYPQGCDVCNHLSLFLCVADYDKLLPGWSHFAQFTIAVVNKDPKKSKYSDTLHRFCKKEHDWGWKKFMELSKVLDGFTVGDTLIIKAQVQVIRENSNRPFRCLDSQYRRELVRVYLTNVEGICRRFVEEKREKLGKVIEDTLRWNSFRAFWAAVEDNARRRLAREKTDVVFKGVVKRFFNEKEVTSTLVMDALYSGCKALDRQNKNKKKCDAVEGVFIPVVWMEKDFFVLAGDILSLLQRAVLEPLPSFKDEKGPQNRTKEGSGEDFGKDYVERDERRLTELGRRTVEMYVLAHLFSNRIEVAYREAVALKRQEELIREEEAAGQAEIELKAKREAAEKEKRSKKKQAKQRRKDRKGKDKDVGEKHPEQLQDLSNSRLAAKQILLTESELSFVLVETGDDEGDSGLDMVDNLGPATEDLEIVTWEREASFVHPEMEASFSGSLSEEAGSQSKRVPTVLDDSSSTCSSDSLPSVRPTTSNSFGTRTNGSEIARPRSRAAVDGFDSDGRLIDGDAVLRTSASAESRNTGEASSSSSPANSEAEAIILSLKERVRWLEKRLQEKEEEVVMLHEQLSSLQHNKNPEGASCDTTSSTRNEPVSLIDGDSVQKGRTSTRPLKTSCKLANGLHKPSWPADNGYDVMRPAKTRSSSDTVKPKPDNEACDQQRIAAPAPTAALARPSTAPILPNGTRPGTSFPPLQPAPAVLSRSASVSGRLNEPASEVAESPAKPLSYRNAAVGKLHTTGAGGTHVVQQPHPVVSSSTYVRPPHVMTTSTPPAPTISSPSKLPIVYEQSQFTQAQVLAAEEPVVCPEATENSKTSQKQQNGGGDVGITFGTITQEVLHSEQQQEDLIARNEEPERPSFKQESPPLEESRPAAAVPEASYPQITPTVSYSHAAENGSSMLMSEDFPHLDIINDLLDEDRSLGRRALCAILSPPMRELNDKHQQQQQQQQHQQQHRRLVMNEREMMLPYGHAHAMQQQGGDGNGIPSRSFWPLSRSMSVNGINYRPEAAAAAAAAAAAQSRYPMVQGHHINHVLVPHDGYSVYAPLQ